MSRDITDPTAPALSRRTLMAGAPAAALMLAHPAAGGTAAPASAQNAGWHRFQLGAFEITVLSDGHLTVPTTGLGTNQDPEKVQAFLRDHYLDPDQTYAHTNHVVIDTGAAKILVDVGSGERFQPSAGALVGNMEAAGLDPAEITHVALTHAHPDHVWGMFDDFDELRLPEADYAISAAEFDWWMAEGRVDMVPETMQAFVVGARNALGPIAERTAMVADGDDIVPGIRVLASPGHTPGHISLLVESEGQTMLVTGDAINHAYVSFAHPDWHFGFDMDKDAAVAMRRRLLDLAAHDRMTVVGYHLPFPGVGHVQKIAGAYRYLPEPWRWGG